MRNSSIELLRIISIMLIVMMHVCSQVEYTEASLSNQMVLQLVNAIGNTGVSCFVLISGYFSVKFKREKFIYLILLSTLYTVAVSYLNNGTDIKSLIMALTILPRYSLWFMVCYLFLMTLSPYINLFCETIDEKTHKNLLLTLFILLCVIPTLFNSATNGTILVQGGKNLVYFIYLYITGRYICKYKDIFINRYKLGGAILGITMGIAFIDFAVSSIIGKRMYNLAYDCSPLIYILSIFIFYFFKSFSYSNTSINVIAKSVLSIYLLNHIYEYLDKTFIHLSVMGQNSLFGIVMLQEVLIVMFVALLVDKTIGKIIEYIYYHYLYRQKL